MRSEDRKVRSKKSRTKNNRMNPISHLPRRPAAPGNPLRTLALARSLAEAELSATSRTSPSKADSTRSADVKSAARRAPQARPSLRQILAATDRVQSVGLAIEDLLVFLRSHDDSRPGTALVAAK